MKGFTLVELIVSIAIFAVMTALVIARYGSFNQGTLLTNMAYDMALTVRSAQAYGISVKSTGDVFNSAYGIHYYLSDKTKFTFYADLNKNGKYDTGEEITTYTLTQGVTISSICLGNDYDTACSNGVSKTSGTFDVTYKRPNPNAIFCTDQDSCPATPNSYPVALINLVSSDGSNIQTVVIRKNGQISVNN